MKNNYKMIIAYDGTRYYGWEHQPNTDMTIQGKLESVLSQMTGEQIVIHGREVCSARTKPHCDGCCLNDICKKNGVKQ